MKFPAALILCAMMLPSASARTGKKTFVYCSEGPPTAFNAQIVSDGTSINATHPLYDRLLDFRYGTIDLVPSLATSWTISKNKLTYTFKLRRGVHFHARDGFAPTRPFNADDVLFSFNRQRQKDHPWYPVNGSRYQYWEALGMNKLVKDLKKIDSHTIQITLHHPEAPFLANLAMPFTNILSKEYADYLAARNKKERIDHHPVGTGPWTLKKYVKDNSIRYHRHPKFWGKPVALDRLVFAITPDASVRYQKLKTGECHLAIDPSAADIPAMKKNPRLKVLKAPGMNVAYLGMNTSKKPFDNVLVRRALNHALDRKAYLRAIYLNNAIIAKNPLPPKLWGYNDKTVDYAYNPKLAKALLAQAGHPNGFATEMWTLPVTRPYNPNGKKMGEMMQADLAKVGIKVKLRTWDWPTYMKRAYEGEHTLLQLGWFGDNGDPDNFLHTLLSCSTIAAGSNTARWCDKNYDRLVTKAKRISSRKKRAELYKQAQVIFKRQAPWVTIAHAIVFRAMSAQVRGYKISPLGGDRFRQVDLVD